MMTDAASPVPACMVCGKRMRPRKTWLWRCPACRLLLSTLPAGAGTVAIDNLDTLRRSNFEILLDRVGKIVPLSGKTVLEVGCSTGLFLAAATQRGAIVTGLEPEKEKADLARAKGFTVIDGFFPDALNPEQRFDLIFFNDVFEHLPDPAAALRACEKHLGPGGLLIINLPDSDGVFYKTANLLDRIGMAMPFDRMWQKSFSSPHVTYFRKKNLERFVTRQTSLKLADQTSLDTLTLAGLKDRISASAKEPLASLIYFALLPIVAAQKVLPPDILVQIFRKS
jgi:2-polyprenyl-3-methyl-5-hydroxy-6-metoxy-1,4-benzoquinol methylase